MLHDGDPLPEVKWFMDGMEIRPSNKYRMSISEDGKAQLVIHDVNDHDAGEITCELSNQKGKESASCKLTVQSELKNRENNPNLYIYIYINCNCHY